MAQYAGAWALAVAYPPGGSANLTVQVQLNLLRTERRCSSGQSGVWGIPHHDCGAGGEKRGSRGKAR